ncbi:unnamed protein product [Orchesella dallaii]|uniref:Uncharacterized protein n=1 Tax=Orchesella dallaii TaxID=48710 RepID=A0ABP1S464_9HEXA
MSTVRLEILLLLLLCWNCTSSGKELKKVTIFKEENFQGEKYERLSSENCTNLPEDLQLIQGSILTSGCVTFHTTENCSSYTGFVVQSREKSLEEALRLSSSYWWSGRVIASYKNCKGLENNKTHDAEMNLYNGLTPARDICGCINEPSGILSHAKLYGNCFKFYQSLDCSGEHTVMKGLTFYFHVRPDYTSYEPCQIPLGCGKLTMMAFNIEPAQDINSFGGTIKNVAIDVKQTFINDGPGTMEESYEVQRNLTETTTLKVSKSLRSLSKSSKSVTTTYQNGSIDKVAGGGTIGVTGPSASPVKGSVDLSVDASKTVKKNLEKVIADESKTEKESSSAEGNAHTIKTEKSFRVEKTIIIQPCTSYEVSSYVKMAENAEINYYMQFEITGVSTTGKRMAYEDLQIGIESQINSEERLEVLHGHPRANNVTVVVQLRIQLVANVGMNSVVTGIGAPLEDCQRRIEYCPSTSKASPLLARRSSIGRYDFVYDERLSLSRPASPIELRPYKPTGTFVIQPSTPVKSPAPVTVLDNVGETTKPAITRKWSSDSSTDEDESPRAARERFRERYARRTQPTTYGPFNTAVNPVVTFTNDPLPLFFPENGTASAENFMYLYETIFPVTR